MIQLEWYDTDKTILHAKFPPRWRWDDAYDLIDRVLEAQNEVDHFVDIIYDLSESYLVPPASLPNLRRLIDSAHPNDRLVVFVSTFGFIRIILNTAMRFTKRDEPLIYHYAESFADALAIIHNQAK